MIILNFSIILHYCLTKTSDLTFIGYHNFWLEYCWMVVTISVRTQAQHDHVFAFALIFLYNIHYVNLDLRPHFLTDGYKVFMSLGHTISFPRNIFMYDLCIYFSISCVSALYHILSLTVSTLNYILTPSVSMFYLSSSLFKLTLTTYPTISLKGDICRFPMIVCKMVQPIEGQT